MILLVLTIFIALITASGYSKLLWWFTILDFFRLQYACLAAIVAMACIYFGQYGLFAINIIIALINLYRIRRFFPHMPHMPKQDANKTLFSINAYKENENLSKLQDILQKTDPEIMLIMEMTEAHEKKLMKLLSKYPYRLQTPVRDGFSICLLSKTVLEDTQITHHGPSDTPLLHAKAVIDGKKYQIYSAHPKPALNKKWHEDRHQYFAEIRHTLAKNNSDDIPVIVMGDFNSVPWEKHFTKFLDECGLRSTIKDQGYKVTWPVYFPVLGIPMDHILISKGEKYNNVQVGPSVGSDHFPLSLNL